MESSPTTADNEKCNGAKLQADRVVPEKEWLQKWETKNIGFHNEEGHRSFKKYLDLLLNGRNGLKIFFPLCGKTIEMKWLSDLGHHAIGVEISESALKEFFTEQNLSFIEETVAEIPGLNCLRMIAKRLESPSCPLMLFVRPFGCDLFGMGGATGDYYATASLTHNFIRSTTGNISLYCCSIYDLTSTVTGKFDGIWDRGSLVAVNPSERERYSQLILSLMNNKCSCLLITCEYDPRKHKGPPFYVPDSEVKSLYGKYCDIKFLEKIDSLSNRPSKWGLDYFFEVLHVLTLK